MIDINNPGKFVSADSLKVCIDGIKGYVDNAIPHVTFCESLKPEQVVGQVFYDFQTETYYVVKEKREKVGSITDLLNEILRG